ncbi:MAG: 2OG-Fe dioxygenase family protein [Gammaproteobacteria bacterium]|nr:2OG-Fe dioxygenase family protein [Gammaproteobacteria bacterium]
MLDETFVERGFEFIDHSAYLDVENSPSLHDLKKIFDLDLEIDQNCLFRKRCYLKMRWDRLTNQFDLAENQKYFQTTVSNKIDGGKVRQFKVMDKKILEIPIIQTLINKNLDMISEYAPLKKIDTLTIGMHFIRYLVNQDSASFSSPDWLHKDDEPLVFVHLIGLSRSALGGDNLIADDNKKVTHVIRLENDLDTLVLNKSVYHAVTPLGSREGVSVRDVILFTVESSDAQINNEEHNAA